MCGTVCGYETLPPTREFPTRRPKLKYSTQIHSALHSNKRSLDTSRWYTACQLTVSHIGPNLVAKCLERRRESSVTIATWLKLHGRGTGVQFQEGKRVLFFFSQRSERLWYSPTLLSRGYRGLLPRLLKPQMDIFKRFSTTNINKHNFNKLR